MDVMVHVVIRGRVQGIGYRAWTDYEARERGIAGWVRNRRDGSVEAVLAGSEEAVSTMVASCHDGPRGAKVSAVNQHDAGERDLALRRSGELFSVLASF